MDYYTILGVPQQADDNQIKQAYRKLAKKYHPDSQDDDPSAKARFQEISEAYAALSDSEQRRKLIIWAMKRIDGQIRRTVPPATRPRTGTAGPVTWAERKRRRGRRPGVYGWLSV